MGRPAGDAPHDRDKLNFQKLMVEKGIFWGEMA
jgi:hypothetical protein